MTNTNRLDWWPGALLAILVACAPETAPETADVLASDDIARLVDSTDSETRTTRHYLVGDGDGDATDPDCDGDGISN